MTLPVKRKLPGTPIPRAQLVAQWEDLHQRNLMKGPVASFLFDVHYSVPEKTYQWRVELDCGCVRDVLTRHQTEDKLADDVVRLVELAGTYYFGFLKPSEREIREANDEANKEVEEDVRAKWKGQEPPVTPKRPSIYGKARLEDGQFLCQDPNCPIYRSHGGPVREIVEWVRHRDDRYVSEPLEIDGKTIRGAREYAVWDVVLSCGHFRREHTELGWNPEDGPAHPKNKKRLPLEGVLDEVARGDPDEEAYWRRMYAEHHPEPAPFTRCHTCACFRSIVAYERVGWLAPKKNPVTPVKPKPARQTLERRLEKLESEAAQLRVKLKDYGNED